MSPMVHFNYQKNGCEFEVTHHAYKFPISFFVKFQQFGLKFSSTAGFTLQYELNVEAIKNEKEKLCRYNSILIPRTLPQTQTEKN